ncbi:AbrB family transcriptional regulator [Falsirhodobacter deserti]|uniref:AbrB family transcriptional regulator n=1 Tax=Falsirhodobacter deserti TaxID=1365611 RepID=UPI000FE3FC70|nr:AbrB family transcriptional regulator [Falsirhodobacter deserti]
MSTRFPPARWPASARWVLLVGIALVLVLLMEMFHLPAALLLGPMFAAIFMAVNEASVRVPRPAFILSQSVVGLMMASVLPLDLFDEIARDWPIFVSGVLFTVLAAAVLGYFMTRAQLFPGTTAIWGSSPGAAAAMVLVSESYGADMRLVAFMQYLRVACCALVSTILARSLGLDPTAVQQVDWFPPLDIAGAAMTLGLAVLAAFAGSRSRIPGGALLVPLMLGLVVKFTGVMPLVLPPWLLALSYAVIGFGVGLRFTHEVVRHAARTFPRVLGSIMILIGVCAGFGYLLHLVAGVDLLTALLATSPGGADTVAIIASSPSMNIDLPFVMAMQVARFIFVVLTAPALARYLSTGARAG